MVDCSGKIPTIIINCCTQIAKNYIGKKIKKIEGGYCVYARGENYKKCENEDDEIDTEPWFINGDLNVLRNTLK